MDMNIYPLRADFHSGGGGEAAACGERRHELMKCSVSRARAHVLMHGGTELVSRPLSRGRPVGIMRLCAGPDSVVLEM